MLHAIVNGHVLFFADCLAALSEVPREKVFTILETGSRPALNALLARCGLGEAVRNLVARLIFHARSADLADDVTARHYVITALTEELIVDHDGNIPPELEDAFSYLSDQNVILARKAARGVMSAFASDVHRGETMPLPSVTPQPVAVIEAVADEERAEVKEDTIATFVPASERAGPAAVVNMPVLEAANDEVADDDSVVVDDYEEEDAGAHHGDINMADAEDLIARAIAKLAALEAESEDADFTADNDGNRENDEPVARPAA